MTTPMSKVPAPPRSQSQSGWLRRPWLRPLLITCIVVVMVVVVSVMGRAESGAVTTLPSRVITTTTRPFRPTTTTTIRRATTTTTAPKAVKRTLPTRATAVTVPPRRPTITTRSSATTLVKPSVKPSVKTPSPYVRPPVTTVPPPPTTTTTLAGDGTLTRMPSASGAATGCGSQDLYGADVHSVSGVIERVCTSGEGISQLQTLVVPAPGGAPEVVTTTDLGAGAAADGWTVMVQVVESTGRTFVLSGSTVRVFETGTGRLVSTQRLSVSGIELMEADERTCDAMNPSGVVYVTSREGRAIVGLDPFSGAEVVRRDLPGRVMSMAVSPRTGRVAVGVEVWPGMTELVLDPTTLSTIASSTYQRIMSGNYSYGRTCDAGGDLTRFENSAAITSVDTASGATSFWIPNPRFASTHGPVVPWAGGDLVRVITDRIDHTTPSLDLLAVVEVNGQFGRRVSDVMSMGWNDTGRLHVFWYDGTISAVCLGGGAC